MLTRNSEKLFEIMDRRIEAKKRLATEEVIKLNQLYKEWKMLHEDGILHPNVTFFEYAGRFLYEKDF